MKKEMYKQLEIIRERHNYYHRYIYALQTRKDDSWITVNGNHILVDDEGNVLRGQAKALSKNKKMVISRIKSPIDKRKTYHGKPSAITTVGAKLNKRQSSLLKKLENDNDVCIVKRNSVKMIDLAALTAHTGQEFAMFTSSGKRLIKRGNSTRVNITVEDAKEMARKGYRFSGHTHPGTDKSCLNASDGDIEIAKAFGMKQSVIYNSNGEFMTYECEE